MSVAAVAAHDQANRVAAERMTAADPVLVDLRPAIDVVPGMTAETILTSGRMAMSKGPARCAVARIPRSRTEGVG